MKEPYSKAAYRQRAGVPYNYRVQYWGNGKHNTYYFDDYEHARNKYMHLVFSQVMEELLVRKVRFERCSYGSYQRIFESDVYHPSTISRPEDWPYPGDQYYE